MISKKIKSFFKYAFSLAIACGLFWYVYKDLNISSSVSKLKHAEYSWIFLSIALALLSHLFRAYRWNLLLEPTEHRSTLFHTFLALMVGYLANLVVPRMGEVSRCGILKKTEEIPMTVSIGTVVAERIIDLCCLLTLVVVGFIVEFDRLNEFLTDFFYEKASKAGQSLFLLYILAGITCVIILAAFLITRLYKERIKKNTFYLKIRAFLREMLLGLTSIKRLEHKKAFWFSTFMIWVLYYLMSYVVIFALESTSSLGLGAGISLLIMGGLGMSAPVQGGIGTYHALITAVLVVYGIKEADGQVFAFILHTSQTLMVIFVGSISFVISMVISKKKHPKAA